MNSQSDNTHQLLDEAEKEISSILDQLHDYYNAVYNGIRPEDKYATDKTKAKQLLFRLFQSQLAAARKAENSLIYGRLSDQTHLGLSDEAEVIILRVIADREREIQPQADTNQSHERGE